jgi:hypothetical protein
VALRLAAFRGPCGTGECPAADTDDLVRA